MVYFIAGELNGLTLEQQTVATELSIVTCFNMRHKLYKAISKVQENAVLSGDVELDPSYTSINLKGTEPANMPRMSKHRGKHKATPYFHHIPGTSHHKICIVAAIDEHDQMLFKIGGLGRESFKILNQYRKHFLNTQRSSAMTATVFRHLYLKTDLKVMSFHLVHMCHRMEIQYHQ